MSKMDPASEWKRIKARLTFLTLTCFIFAGAVLTRAALIQIKGDARLEEMGRRQFHSKVLLRPRRGLVLDRNGEPFAVNIETRSLAANPSKFKDKKALVGPLAKSLGLPVSKLKEKFKENASKEFIWIRRHLSEEAFGQFKKFGLVGNNGELVDGLWLVRESQRVYPHAELASQILGSVNIDAEGVEGVEFWQNERLRGKVISMNAVRDALGRPAFIDTVAAKHIKEGEPITLTLDASLQFSVEQELREAVSKSRAQSGSVIVMNAENGEILAMASDPTFNPNQRGAPLSARRSKAITDGYEPGSTVKPLLMAAALSSGWQSTDRIHGGGGQLMVQGRLITEAETHEKFEWISLSQAIIVSSNIVAAKVAMKLGSERVTQVLKLLGFGSKPQTGFPGEIGGWVPPAKGMQPLSLANIGFGQGLFVSPLQVARAYAALANGGWLVRPKLIKDPYVATPEDAPRRLFSKAVVDRVLDAMVGVTEDEHGTGKKARLDGYRVAGKTGTSQTVDPKTKKYSRTHYIASFVGFAVDVQPKLVIYTQINGPQGSYYAAETAAPLFQKVLRVATNRFGMPMNPKFVLASSAPSSVSTSATAAPIAQAVLNEERGKDQIQTSSAASHPVWEDLNQDGKVSWRLPDFRGLSAREVVQSIKDRDFNLAFHGFGVVKSQNPSPGSIVHPGEKVEVLLSE